MLDSTLICDACGGQVAASQSIITESGHVFCCEIHQDLFSDRHQSRWPEPKNQEGDFMGDNDLGRQLRFIGCTFLLVCIMGMAQFIYEVCKVFQGGPLNIPVLLISAGMGSVMGLYYYILRRDQRAFSLMIRLNPDKLKGRDFSDHIEELYRKNKINKREVFLVAKYAFIPELNIVAKKIRAGDV